jgi:hypothetical protein
MVLSDIKVNFFQLILGMCARRGKPKQSTRVTKRLCDSIVFILNKKLAKDGHESYRQAELRHA